MILTVTDQAYKTLAQVPINFFVVAKKPAKEPAKK